MGDHGRGKALLTRVASAALALLVAAMVVIGALYLRSPRATLVGVGDTVPEFRLPTVVEGALPHPLAPRGGPALIVFFDTRWPSTERYLPYLDRMYRRYFRRGLRMMAVALDSDPAAAREFARRKNLAFTVLSDPDASTVAKVFGVPRDPEAYLLDPQGRVEAVFTRQIDWSDPAIVEMLERYLGPER